MVPPNAPMWVRILTRNALLVETCSPPSALHAVAQVGHTVLAHEGSRPDQLDVLGGEAVEESAPLAEEHRDDVELELVEDTGRERELRDARSVHEHVLLARGGLGPGHHLGDV